MTAEALAPGGGGLRLSCHLLCLKPRVWMASPTMMTLNSAPPLWSPRIQPQRQVSESLASGVPEPGGV